MAKLWLGRAGLKFESFHQTVASCEHVATRLAPRKHNCCSSFSATTQTCEKKRQDRWVGGESLKITWGRPVFIANRSAEEKLRTLCKPWNVHSFLTTGSRCIFCKRSVWSTRTRTTRKRGFMPWVRIHLFASCGVQRYGPPLAQQNMLLTRLLPLFKSKARFLRDHSIKPLRGCAVFSCYFVCSYLRHGRRKGRSLIWQQRSLTFEHRPGPVSLQSAFCPCTYSVRFAPVWSSTLCDTTVDPLTFTAFSGPPSRGWSLCWCSSNSPLNHASV